MDVKEAIKECKETIGNFKSAMTEFTKDIFPKKIEAIEVVLSELETYKTKYENLKLRNKGTKEASRVSENLEKQFSEEVSTLEAELEKKEKIIGLMAEQIFYWQDDKFPLGYSKKDVIDYFTKKCEGK